MWHKAHFIGVGGVGMSAVAKLLLDQGTAVTGSDEEVYPPISTYLEQIGLHYLNPYQPSNISPDVDLIVIGKNAKLVPETNEEVRAAYASGKTILSYPEVLAELSKEKENIVVAGSYGKSTSTALFAHCLESVGVNPAYFIGAVPVPSEGGIQANAKMGKGRLFVIEGDEYPSSNTDHRAKFLHYHPRHVLLTPLAHDHFNIFATPADYIEPFAELVRLIPEDGTLVACAEGPLSTQFVSNILRPKITYGLREGDYTAADIEWGEKTSFTILHHGELVVRVETSQLGEHNIQNIVGVAALLLSLILTTPEQLQKAVASFKGIVRRLDRKSEHTSIPIFEGFGSSYEKARSAMEAIKKHFPGKRVVVVFEPNTFSWRNRASLPQYENVFSGVDKVYLFDPPHDGKESELTLEDIATPVRQSGLDVTILNDAEDGLKKISDDMQAEDVILFLSSGPLGGLIESIPKLAEKKFPR